MTFAEALARIEELVKDVNAITLTDADERAARYKKKVQLLDILYAHADEVVQLGKVCASLESAAQGLYALCPQLAYVPLDEALAEYRSLMKGE